MSIDVTKDVAGLVDETERIEGESESVYLELGRLFPRLVSEMEISADNAAQSLRGFDALVSEGHSSNGAHPADEGNRRASLRSMRSFAEDSSAYFRDLHESDSSFLATINESIERLSSLEEIITRVRSDSEEMEIISLNAMTVALKSGAEGKAFSVITDELKRLSTRTIAVTEEVTARGRSLLESFGRLRASLGELDEFQSGFFAQLETTLSGGYEAIERQAVDAARFFGELLAQARGVREPVTRIMQEVQLQDIVRQSLQHVGISLKEVLTASDEGEGLAFVAAVAELSEALVGDVVAKLDSSAASFGKDMAAVRDIVSGCERKRSDFLVGAEGSLGAVDSARFTEGSARYLDLKRSAIASSRKLSEQVKSLDESFKNLDSLLSRFQTIVVASRIEVAKTRALLGVNTTVQEMILLTDRIEADVGNAMETTKDFIRAASSAIGEYAASDVGESGEGKLTATLERVEEDVGSLDAARLAVRKAVNDFSLYTADFIKLTRNASELLDRLGSLSGRLGSVRAQLGALKEGARAELGPESRELKSDRLRKMVERFTIFTHKKAAGAIGRFDVEAGADAGEVTLF
jgi:hypothetical protein